MLNEAALLASLILNVVLVLLVKKPAKVVTVEKIVEKEVGIPVGFCELEHVCNPQWTRRDFSVGSGNDGWSRNWEGKDQS